MNGNARVAIGIEETGTWDDFDALPSMLRHEMNYAPLSFTVGSVLEKYRHERRFVPRDSIACIKAMQEMREQIAVERILFAEEYQTKYGVPYPHVASGVSELWQ